MHEHRRRFLDQRLVGCLKLLDSANLRKIELGSAFVVLGLQVFIAQLDRIDQCFGGQAQYGRGPVFGRSEAIRIVFVKRLECGLVRLGERRRIVPRNDHGKGIPGFAAGAEQRLGEGAGRRSLTQHRAKHLGAAQITAHRCLIGVRVHPAIAQGPVVLFAVEFAGLVVKRRL